MLFAATFFLVLPRMLARLYTRDPLVTGIAVRLLPIAGFFQVFDGLQVVAAGVLRGLGDTRVPMLISLLGFWLLGGRSLARVVIDAPEGAVRPESS